MITPSFYAAEMLGCTAISIRTAIKSEPHGFTGSNIQRTTQENRTSQDYIQVRFNSASVMLNANGKELERTGKSYDYREMDSEMCYAEDSNVSVGEAEKCLRDILTYYYGEEGSDIEIDYVRVLDRGRDKKGNVYDQNPDGQLLFPFLAEYLWNPVDERCGSIYKVIVRSDSLMSELDRIALIGQNWQEIMSRSVLMRFCNACAIGSGEVR